MASNPYTERFGAILCLSEATRRKRVKDLEAEHFGKETEPTSVQSQKHTGGIESRWASQKRKKRQRIEQINDNVISNSSEGVKRLLTFLKIMDICADAPWSPIRFTENEKMIKRLIASHMQLITGRDAWVRDKNLLFSLLDSSENLSHVINVCWVTNRQQGKTTTLSRFLAVLALCSVKGGVLATVYSTSLDRSCELVKSSKKYLYWMQHDKEVGIKLEKLGLKRPKIATDNERQFSVQSIAGDGILNTVIGRPKNADSCRGDAPHAAFFDEVGFISAAFWWSFAFPLLQVGGRVFTLATTPPALDSFFDDFCKKIRSENEQGKYFFQLTNHSLVCEKCIEKDPQQCSHKLYLVPPWKSIARFENLRRMVPGKQREEFSAEVFGVLKRSSTNYFPAKIVHATLNWTNSKHVREINFVGLSSADTSTFVIFVAIDPASHQKSSMGLSAISYTDTGQIVLLGISEVPMQSSDLLQCQMICERFIFRLFASLTSGMVVDLSRTTIVPVVECNNNDILALSLVRCLRSAAGQIGIRSGNPFKKQYFQTGVTDNIGVLTTESTKYAAIQCAYSALFENRIFLSKEMTTLGPVHLPRHTHPSKIDALALLQTELTYFRETDRGPSGKGSDRNDDLAMSFMLALYWSHCVRATANVHGNSIIVN